MNESEPQTESCGVNEPEDKIEPSSLSEPRIARVPTSQEPESESKTK